ncbi:MAG: hypothetical protein R3C56_35510 [Pirellulaceae bacterium]
MIDGIRVLEGGEIAREVGIDGALHDQIPSVLPTFGKLRQFVFIE